MTNTRQHAYPDLEPDKGFDSSENNEWWMFSQEKDQALSVVFCDLGIGIPTSLPHKKPGLWRKISKKFGGTPNDSEVIKEAIQYSKSRTKSSHRGKGLKQLTGILEKTTGGMLHLYSNHGCYSSINGEIELNNYKDSIHGTLIAWSVPLTE